MGEGTLSNMTESWGPKICPLKWIELYDLLRIDTKVSSIPHLTFGVTA